MTKLCLLICLSSFIIASSYARSCRNDTFRQVKIREVTYEYFVKFNETDDSLRLMVTVNFDSLYIPDNVELDGFVFNMQVSGVTFQKSSITPSDVCNPGFDYYWVKTDNTTCLNATTICGEHMDAPPGYRLCPYNFNTEHKDILSCTGTGNGYVYAQEYITVPANIRNVTFPVDFRTTYYFQIHPYYREFISMLQPEENSKQILALLDCPQKVSEDLGKPLLESTNLCCEQGFPHNSPRNISFHNFKIDFYSYSVNYTIRWLPPITQENITDYIIFPNPKGIVLHSFPIAIAESNYSTYPLSEAQMATLADCDTTTEYYETTLSKMVPGVEYQIQLTPMYEDEQHASYGCYHSYCTAFEDIAVPVVDVCEAPYRYCVKNANCTAEDPTGTTSLNASCVCPANFEGNGINQTNSALATGCSSIDVCVTSLSPCHHSSVCFPEVSGASCMCRSGFFGDGYKNGSGCTSISRVALGVVIPSIIIIGLIIAYVAWKIVRRRDLLNDLKWSQFVANDALKTYTITNMLNDDGDEICMPTFGDKWEIDRTKLALGKILGRGNYGIVYQGLYEEPDEYGQRTEVPVAIKTVKEGADEDVHVADFLAEIGFMLNVGDHPNVLKVIGCCTTQKPVFLVTDLLKYGDLLHFLWDAREPAMCLVDPVYHLTEKSLYEIARQVAEGMDYLTQARIIHGDLAARNILVGENLSCKISDFGLANDVYRYGVIRGQSERCVPFKWISPERMMAGKVPITSKSDVWSFGNLMYEMVTLGCMPHPGISSEDLYDLLKSGYRMKQPSTCSKEMWAVMTKCWKWRPSSRPNFAKLVEIIDDVLGGGRDKAYVNLAEAVQELDKNEVEQHIPSENFVEKPNVESENNDSSDIIKNTSPLIHGHTNEAFEVPTAI